MSLVNVTSVEVGKNPTSVLDGFRFEVVFECLERLEEDLEWKLIYVGSSDDKSLDQELDCVVMGPINRGALKFTFETEGPDFSKIHAEDIHGFTIVLLTGSYRDEEFIRIGWYVHNVYPDTELEDDPPELPLMDKLQRVILTDAPRVTRFKISWDNPKIHEAEASSSQQVDDLNSGMPSMAELQQQIVDAQQQQQAMQQQLGIPDGNASLGRVVGGAPPMLYPDSTAGPFMGGQQKAAPLMPSMFSGGQPMCANQNVFTANGPGTTESVGLFAANGMTVNNDKMNNVMFGSSGGTVCAGVGVAASDDIEMG